MPIFEVDPFWPKTMPNNWVFGQTIGLGIDEKDQVWIIHRGNDPGNLDATEFAHPPAPRRRGAGAAPRPLRPAAPRRGGAGGTYTPGPNPVSECCDPAPPVVAFDQAGNVVYSWGGPSLHPDWPESNHGIVVDHKGIVWIGGNGGPDSHILKFTREGKFVGMFGKKGARMVDGKPVANSNDMDNFGRVAKIFIDPKANEAYVADGYFNKRVAVDRHGFGQDQAVLGRLRQQARRRADAAATIRRRRSRSSSARPCTAPSCRTTAFVYVCDRPNDRIQVFTKEGKFVKEKQLFPETLSDGSVWDVAFSRDPQQRYLYVADGANEHVYILDRNSLEVALAVRRRAAVSPGSSAASTASRSIRRATSTRPKPTPANACRSSCSRAWARRRRACRGRRRK